MAFYDLGLGYVNFQSNPYFRYLYVNEMCKLQFLNLTYNLPFKYFHHHRISRIAIKSDREPINQLNDRNDTDSHVKPQG